MPARARASAPSRRCSTAYREPDIYGSLVLLSGSFVFTDIAAADHGGGPVFDPVVRFVNRYRARPRRVADRHVRQLRRLRAADHAQPLDGARRSRRPAWRCAYVETRDGHSWENWRDSLRDALSWAYPGPQKLFYE